MVRSEQECKYYEPRAMLIRKQGVEVMVRSEQECKYYEPRAMLIRKQGVEVVFQKNEKMGKLNFNDK